MKAMFRSDYTDKATRSELETMEQWAPGNAASARATEKVLGNIEAGINDNMVAVPNVDPMTGYLQAATDWCPRIRQSRLCSTHIDNIARRE